MICRAKLSLLLFSSAPWPPRPKIPTRNPGLPRLRVGIMFWMTLAAAGLFSVDVTSPDAEAAITPADRPAAIDAAPVLRKPRRFWLPASCGVSFVFMSIAPSHPKSNPDFLQHLIGSMRVYLSLCEAVNRSSVLV